MKAADIYVQERLAGLLWQDEDGYHFRYDETYRADSAAVAVSLTLPFRADEYRSPVLFPFFDGLIPEGWLLDVAKENWKLDPRDRMGLLLTCCRDCIGAVSVRARTEADDE